MFIDGTSWSGWVQEAESWERVLRHHWRNYRQRWNDRGARRYYAERVRSALARVRYNRRRLAEFG